MDGGAISWIIRKHKHYDFCNYIRSQNRELLRYEALKEQNVTAIDQHHICLMSLIIMIFLPIAIYLFLIA